ncbi:MAG TPA: hypothetical protein VJS92_03695 [Candidatus Polarisedimenticolaceae bacterium]|nr:hypothetical protein [Candidatus Polarisedimenticolaceae bacterium]
MKLAGILTLVTATALLASAPPVDLTALYSGKSPKDAASALLQKAEEQAGTGSWELIAVARVHYLSGDKKGGQALLDRAISRKAEASDWKRIARVYAEAGDWELAVGACDKALALKPKEDTLLAECGGIYNQKGDRAKAEELFQRSFAADSSDVYNTLAAAESYLKLRPR